MKFLTVTSVFESWKQIHLLGEGNKASLNKFFGLLELMKHLDTPESHIEENVQYRIVSSDLSNTLESIYSFRSDPRAFTSSEELNVVFPKSWQNSVLVHFLKNKPLPLRAVAAVCLQLEQFVEESHAHLEEEFKRIYNVSDREMIFFENESDTVIDFVDDPFERHQLFGKIKGFLNSSEDSKFTVGFTKVLYDKRAGELTAGPFIQPLYSGQENLKCLLIASFDIKEYYNINQGITKQIKAQSDVRVPRNKIIYGAPGTGKSFELQSQAYALGFTPDNTIRLTFHPTYSYQQFVGSYKPTPVYKQIGVSEGMHLYGPDKKTQLPDQKEPIIDYSFIEGPFLTQLINALRNPTENFLLILEEINRASVSSVFGEVFQLLDRNDRWESEYSVTFNRDVSNYLRAKDVNPDNIKLPSNLFLWATMNSADQGVMPLDAAFKRRWSFEYLPLNGKEHVISERSIIFQNKIYSWNRFRHDLNKKLKEIPVAEDKLIGPFFLSKDELMDSSVVVNKLLLYLRDDVVRHNPEALFRHKTFSDIVSAYTSQESIFVGLDPENWQIEEN